MYIYKFIHTESGRAYIGQTIQNPNRCRLEHIADSRNTPRTYHFHNALKNTDQNHLYLKLLQKRNLWKN